MSGDRAGQNVSRRDALIFLFKYRRRFMLAFAIPVVLCALIAICVAPRYNVESVLVVRLGAEYVYNPEVSDSRDGANSIIPYSQVQIFKPEVALLSSEDLHADVVKAIGISRLFPDMDGVLYHIGEAVNDALEGIGIVEKTSPEEKDRQQLARAVVRFDKRFDITLDKDSSVITVSFAHKDASLAAQTLETLLKLYAEKRRTVYLEPRTELAGTEKEISRERFARSEQALQSFKRQYHIHSFGDERKELLAQRDKAMEQASLVSSAGLNGRIADYNRQLERLDFLERDYQLLQKDVTMANDAYALYSRKFDEAVAMENIGRKRLDSVRIVQNPTIPAEPSHIRAWILLAGAFLGLMSLFFTVSFTRFMRNSFFTMEEVEQETELKVITSFTESDDMEHESMQRLIDSLGVAAGKDKNRIVTFISARSGEGTSHVSWNYAMKLAEETGRKVLLIDAGKHSAARMQEYGYIPGNGIIDAYIENKPADETLREIGKGLFVCRFIRAEKNHARAGEVISENDFWKALTEITPHIVIDAPPLQASYDGVLLAAKSGATVAVIEAEKTPAEAVNNLYNKLKTAGAKVTGAVVNKRHYHIPDRIYKAL